MLPTSTKYPPVQYPWGNFSSEDFLEEAESDEFVSQSAESKKAILDFLGSSPWETQSETSAYRRHGEDTQTWGSLEQWILVEWMSNILEVSQDERMRRQPQYAKITSIIAQARLNELDNYYEYRGMAKVRDYLLAHPDLIDFLKDSYFQLDKYFGSETAYTLEVVHDPENPQKMLFVYISTSLSRDQALSALDRFDDEWFLGQVEYIGNRLNFNLEIVELEKSAKAGNEQAFIEASKKISWQTRPPEDFLRAIHLAFAAGAHLSARRLAAKGIEQYPQHQELQKYARILALPKLIQSNLPPDKTLGANRDWLKKHKHNYSEEWLALKDGELLGAAMTLRELMDSIGKREGILFTKGR